MEVPFTERTLLLIKPDATRRGLIGEIIGRFERAGLYIVGLKLVHPTLDFAREHRVALSSLLCPSIDSILFPMPKDQMANINTCEFIPLFYDCGLSSTRNS